MLEIPKLLFEKATAWGFVCIPSDLGEHCIKPRTEVADWHLTYRKGRWVLTVHGVPQMHFQYEDVIKFLERCAQTSTS